MSHRTPVRLTSVLCLLQRLSGQVLMATEHALGCQHTSALAHLSLSLCHMGSAGHLAPTWLLVRGIGPRSFEAVCWVPPAKLLCSIPSRVLHSIVCASRTPGASVCNAYTVCLALPHHKEWLDLASCSEKAECWRR